MAKKNKIYFIWKLKKDSYLCTPNGNEGKTKPERRMSGRDKKKIETDETYAGRKRPAATEPEDI